MRQPMKGDWEFHSIDIADPEHAEFINAVGRVAILSAELESALRFLFYRLMNRDEALVISEGETPDWLLKNCERLINEEHRHESAKEGRRTSILPLIKNCREIFQERGTIIHSSWGGRDDGTYIAMNSKRGRSMLAYQHSVADIHDIADKFADLASEIHAIEGYGV